MNSARRLVPLLIALGAGCSGSPVSRNPDSAAPGDFAGSALDATAPFDLAPPDLAPMTCTRPTHAGSPLAIKVSSTRDVGVIGSPPTVLWRDGGASAKVGSGALILFGDTLLKMPASDGANYRSATAGWSEIPGPTSLTEELDAAGAPLQLLPFTAEEKSYNDAHARTDQDRIALWPGSVVEDCDGSAAIFYLKLYVHSGVLNFQSIGVGVAHLQAGHTVATRDAKLLFNAPEPDFNVGAVVDGAFAYVYACRPVPMQFDQECRVSRAPLGRLGDRSAWEFFDGSAWSADVDKAQPVLHGAPGDLSVSWNDHQRAFLAVHSEILSPKIDFKVAPRPEGPWSAGVVAVTGLPPGPMQFDYAGKEHPEFASDGGRTVLVTYARALTGLTGELRAVQVTLN